MPFQLNSALLVLLLILINSCQSQSVVNPLLVQDPPTLFAEMTCEQLIEKSNDAGFALKGLAGLKAHKNCKNYRFDFQKLSELEKKIYSEEIDELDPKKPASPSSLSVYELQSNLKKAISSEDRFKAYKQLRSKQKSQGQRNDFLKTTADLFNWAKADWKKNKKKDDSIARFYEATILFARTYWTEEKLSQAEKILNETLRLLKGSTSVAEIYFLKGRMADEKSLFEDVLTQYDLALEDMKQYRPKNLSFSVDRLLWLKSWVLYKNKKYELAQKSFAELWASTPENSEKSKALFYQARCFNQLDKKDEAKKLLETITKDDFFSFYGLVAYNELGIKFPALSQLKLQKKFAFDLELNFLAEPERKLFKELIHYKEVEIAERSVAYLAKSNEKQVNLGLYLADKAKRFLPLFASFSKLDNADKTEVLLTYSDLLFPQPHLENVKTMSEKTQIPVSLIYSIMKQESAFNEKTRSHADAMGLMQLIPRLAKQLSKKFDTRYSKPDDLFNPEINIQLGTYELMEQVRKQSGQLTFVAAAYNAGPNALSNWLKTKKHTDIVEFIEEIPYDETRTYVKIIARNKLFYERISKRDEEHSFPIEFLVTPITE
jgi:soluble lytic murein transglycosylase